RQARAPLANGQRNGFAADPGARISYWLPYGMLRSAASPGSRGVRPAWGGWEWPLHTPSPAGHLAAGARARARHLSTAFAVDLPVATGTRLLHARKPCE